MLGHNEGPPERDHHQDSEQTPEYRDEHDTGYLKVEAEYEDSRHRDADTEGDGFAGGASSLDDVVFEDRRVAQAEPGEEAEESDRDDSDGNGCADRQPDFEDEVK